MMIAPQEFVEALERYGTDFFCGVPDSLLKNLCAYITDTVDAEHHIITANEGNAVALAAGHHLATGSIPFVYMQNSGQGNAINPLLSLVDEDVYQIPMLLCVGWRGEPGIKDEPQHLKQGKVTLSIFEAVGIPYQTLSTEPAEVAVQLSDAYVYMQENSAPYALVIRKGVFAPYELKQKTIVDGAFTREQALEIVVDHLPPDAIVVSTTGMVSRELYEIREKREEGHHKDFLTVGSMGHASQIALGVALAKKERPVVCIDGDGAALMHLGGAAIIANAKPKRFLHIILNNGAHDSVGGQPTVGRSVDLVGTLLSLGYAKAVQAKTQDELIEALSVPVAGPYCIEVLVKKGNRPDLGRPKSTPVENKHAFMRYMTEAGV
jgi:phosphonopyruvate decarboxylase